MIKSMTGFGREHQILNGRDILVEIRSVNHRFYEFNAKIPRSYMYLEDKLKTLLQGKISRGKVDVSVSIYNITANETQVTVNKEIVSNYINAVRGVKDELGLIDDLSLSNVLTLPDAFSITKAEVDEDAVWTDVATVATTALDKFVTMRTVEGERMRDDVLSKLSSIKSMVEEVEVLSPKNVEDYRTKLYDKMKEVLGGTGIDEQRILLEAAIFSEKTAVDEETVRLKSHICQFDELLHKEDAVGRKLDFLVQELNRETNTIGSKAQDIKITRLVVEMKSEIEKIREQIQNIE